MCDDNLRSAILPRHNRIMTRGRTDRRKNHSINVCNVPHHETPADWPCSGQGVVYGVDCSGHWTCPAQFCQRALLGVMQTRWVIGGVIMRGSVTFSPITWWFQCGRLFLFCSLAVLDPRVGHTMDVLSSFISVLCHSDWLFHGESCPRIDVVHPGRTLWSSSPVCIWHCFLHYLFLQATPLFSHGVTIVC